MSGGLRWHGFASDVGCGVLHDDMAGFGNTFDGLWFLAVLCGSQGATLLALQKYGLIGWIAFPVSLVLLGLLAVVAYSRAMRPSDEFMLRSEYGAQDNAPIDVLLKPNGWVACPTCGQSFLPHDQRVWNGERHNCGQRLILSRRT